MDLLECASAPFVFAEYASSKVSHIGECDA